MVKKNYYQKQACGSIGIRAQSQEDQPDGPYRACLQVAYWGPDKSLISTSVVCQVKLGKPYCEGHVSVAYQPMSTRRERDRKRQAQRTF